MQRSTPLDSSGRADRGMVHLQGTNFSISAHTKLFKIAQTTCIRSCILPTLVPEQ
jgi:hypothetical protein